MTTPFENFVNTALGKSLSADVTLPTADDIPVFTGIGRQVTGKTIAELGLALSADLDTDGTLAANSDTKYPSQKAVKTYADTKQPIDATLTALAGISTTIGFLVQTAADTFAQRSLSAGVCMAISNVSGQAADPVLNNIGRRRVVITAPSSSYNLVVNTAYAVAATNNTTMVLPSGEADGDTIEIQQAANSGTTAGALAANTVTSASTRYIRARGVGSGTSVSLSLPDNAAEALTSTYQFTWNATDGVWYYHKKSAATLASVQEKDASFTAVAGVSYFLGTTATTMNIQFPMGVAGQRIDLITNNAPSARTVNFVPPSGQHVVYVGAGTYIAAAGYVQHLMSFVFNSSNSVWELLIIPTGRIIDTLSFVSSTNASSTVKLNLATASGNYQWYTPSKNINFGDLSNVATTNSNVLGGTDCRIEGGTNNNVSGTGCETINCFYTTLSGTLNTAINCGESGSSFTGSGTENTFINCRGATQGSGSAQCTFQDMWNVNTSMNNITFPAGSKIQGLNYAGFSVDSSLQGSQSASTAVQCLGGGIAPWAYLNQITSLEGGFHEIDIMGQETVAPYNAMIGRRHVTFLNNNSGGSVLTPVVVGTDVTKNGAAYTITVTEVSGRLVITCNMTSSANTVLWRCRVRSTYQ